MSLDQTLINNNSNENKKICFELIPIDACLICTGECFHNGGIYSKCRFECHNNKNGLKLISDEEREYGPAAFAEMCREHLKNGGDPDVL